MQKYKQTSKKLTCI